MRGNRYALGKLYDEQKVSRSKNVVQELGGNWLKDKTPKTPEAAQAPARRRPKEPSQEPLDTAGEAQGEQGQVARYQQRLEQQRQRGRDLDERSAPRGSTYFERDDAGFGLAVPQMGGYDADAKESRSGAPQASPATGLSSLDLGLPDRDGAYRVFLFTTPRGEVQITGWAVSERSLHRLGHLAALAAVALLAAIVFLVVRNRWYAGLGSRHGSTL